MKILRLLLVLSVLAIVMVSFMPYPSGAPSPYYYTGSPGDGHNCSQCHGTASTVSGWITSNIPASGYVPGTAYLITATNTISGSGRYGFEVSPQNATGTLLGTLAAGTNSKLVGSNKWVTHSSASNSISSWTFTWTAPVAGTGDVTFYGSFARSTGSVVKLSTLLVSEQTGGSLPGAAGPITGLTTTCQNSSGTYSVGTIAGANSYVWSVPAGSTITTGQGTTSITVNFGPAAISGNISVYGTNTTGNGIASNLAVTVNTLPAASGTISGNTAPCQGSTQTYSVPNTAGISYNWVVPAGSSITSGQGTSNVTILVGGSNGNIEVVPSNNCGNGNGSSIPLTVSLLPSQPGTIVGLSVVCVGATSDYSVPNVNGVTYTWAVPSGTLINSGQGTNSINVTIGSGSGNIEVVPSNTCGNGTGRALFITVNTAPAQPSVIEGPASPCQGSSATYSVANVAGTTYTWQVPTGSVITSGQGTNSITITVGSTAGDIAVVPGNVCGTGPGQSKTIQVNTIPAQPSAISGAIEPCQGSSQVYSVDNVASISYTWSVPSASVILSGQGTSSINITVGATSGNVEVLASSNCGNSPAQVKQITVLPLPGFTAAISGPSQVNIVTTTSSSYSTSGALNAVSYIWDLSPVSAGTIAGSGLTGTVTWNATFLGMAFIKAKAINSCGEGAWSDIKETMVVNNTGLEELVNAGIRIFPSPSNGHFNLEITGAPGTVLARIFNPAGLELYSTSIPVNVLSTIDVNLPSGLYILVIENGTEIIKKKLMIQK